MPDLGEHGVDEGIEGHGFALLCIQSGIFQIGKGLLVVVLDEQHLRHGDVGSALDVSAGTGVVHRQPVGLLCEFHPFRTFLHVEYVDYVGQQGDAVVDTFLVLGP